MSKIIKCDCCGQEFKGKAFFDNKKDYVELIIRNGKSDDVFHLCRRCYESSIKFAEKFETEKGGEIIFKCPYDKYGNCKMDFDYDFIGHGDKVLQRIKAGLGLEPIETDDVDGLIREHRP